MEVQASCLMDKPHGKQLALDAAGLLERQPALKLCIGVQLRDFRQSRGCMQHEATCSHNVIMPTQLSPTLHFGFDTLSHSGLLSAIIKMVVREVKCAVDAQGVAVLTLNHPPVNALHPQGALFGGVRDRSLRVLPTGIKQADASHRLSLVRVGGSCLHTTYRSTDRMLWLVFLIKG